MSVQIPKPYRDIRPWGSELWLAKEHESPSMVKLLQVNPGETLSLQFHHNRDEFWHVISGDGFATIDEARIPIGANSDCYIPRGMKHRLESGTSPLIIVELAFGEFDENDIIRLEDRYGRT